MNSILPSCTCHPSVHSSESSHSARHQAILESLDSMSKTLTSVSVDTVNPGLSDGTSVYGNMHLTQ